MKRARITDRSGRVCMDVEVADVSAIHGNPDGGSAELVFKNGHVVALQNVELRHVFDMVWPRSDDAPAAGIGYEPPEGDA